MSTVIYTKLSDHKGSRRLWLEGRRLARMGIAPGATYRLRLLEGSQKGIKLTFEPKGELRVSRRRRGGQELPVIDVCNQELVRAFGTAEAVRVVVKGDAIYVTLEHRERAQIEREERLRSKLERGEALQVGSIAHGGGILDHAIHTGLNECGVRSRLAFANELEGEYLDASLANNPVWDAESIAIEGSMEAVEWRKLPKVDLLLAGLPCTGASKQGRVKNRLARAEEHETAGSLFVAFLSAIQTLQPSIILLENVPQYASTASMAVIRQVLGSLGYTVHEAVLDGHALGALERRERLCVVAAPDWVDVDLEELAPVREREPSVGSVLETLPADDERWRHYGYLADKEVRDREAGRFFRRQLLDGTEDGLGTIGRGYAKARSTEPFITHPSGDGRSRLLTPLEHARVKAIPESLIRDIPSTRAHEVLGQSVVHCAFKAVGRMLARALSAPKAVPCAA